MTFIKFRALSHNDQRLFFEALGEFGKDFQNIQQYMVQKGDKLSSRSTDQNKSSDQNKSLDPQEKREHDKKEDEKKLNQIRNFYNKLYKELSQHIDTDLKQDLDRIEKVNQELYLLINYGEIWKKHGKFKSFKFNDKTRKLLEQLVSQGSTTIRFRNKNVRLRTPPCKALKKINEIGIDEKVKVVTARELPKDVLVEFHPASNRDWLKVQSISQNPRVRARLSIQKRLSTVLEFLENKWNISQNKLNHTVDVWLKVTPNSQQTAEDLNLHANPSNASTEDNCNSRIDFQQGHQANDDGDNPVQSNVNNINCKVNSANIHDRIRLKPSAQHELKEVNIIRVMPDSHLDLSLKAYINRLGESKLKNCEQSSKVQSNKDQQANGNNLLNNTGEYPELSQDSKVHVSLTTPDSSIILERSCTSDQPSIAKARKHLNFLQSLAGSFEGCENSRTWEDTPIQSTPMVIPALYDEDAALPQDFSGNEQPTEGTGPDSDNQSVDFHIPKKMTLIDYFKAKTSDNGVKIESDEQKLQQNKESNQFKPQDHKIEIQKFAEGWTRQDADSSMTVGELYLAFKCPEKIILEYEFEQFTYEDVCQATSEAINMENLSDKPSQPDSKMSIMKIQESPSDSNILIFKLLTAASLSLAHIGRQKQEQQHKLHDQQSCSRLKRRKGSGQGVPMTLHDIEATNQRVEEALKQLQPTRLSSYRRAR